MNRPPLWNAPHRRGSTGRCGSPRLARSGTGSWRNAWPAVSAKRAERRGAARAQSFSRQAAAVSARDPLPISLHRLGGTKTQRRGVVGQNCAALTCPPSRCAISSADAAGARVEFEVVSFDQSHAGGVILAAEDGGVVTGRQSGRRCVSSRLSVGGTVVAMIACSWSLLQSSFSATSEPLALRSSSIGSWSAPFTPAAARKEGPMARTMIRAMAPVEPSPMITPPIMTLSPVSTKPRVLRLASSASATVSRS